MVEWIQKQDPNICCLHDTCRFRDTYQLKVRGWIKVFQADGKKKKAGLVTLIIRQNRL